MKKLTVTLLLLALYGGLAAQYKKATFLDRPGRTYGFNPKLYAMGDGKGTPVGFAFTFGQERMETHWVTNWEIQFVPSYKYEGPYGDGKARSQFILGFNYGYNFLKNEEAPKKFNPYLIAGWNIILYGGAKKTDWNAEEPYISKKTLSAGFGGGAGVNYNFASRCGLKLEGGYTYQINRDYDESDAENMYFMFTSHPYVSLGIFLRIIKD